MTHLPRAEVTRHCAKLAALGFKPTQVLDVAANRGMWSAEVRAIYPGAAFTLIEPQVELKPFLEDFCASSPGSRWINAGAGAAMGELKFTVCDTDVSSSFTIPDDEARRRGWSQRVVPVVTLDHVCANVIGSIPEMVKLDVEGYEHEVLAAAA